jgi:SHS family sialic acid transporter-like MFS transporter
MGGDDKGGISRGQWLALAAALLGWMFDGLEQGLFPLAGRRALLELLPDPSEDRIALWFSVATGGYLVGAATGGVLFGWLGDRIGRVRAMSLSVLTYALFSGLCAFAQSATQIALLRFLSSLGMGGEWSLGVALVMEIWPDKSRSLLAGFIGAAANAGYLLLSIIGVLVNQFLDSIATALNSVGLAQSWVEALMRNQGWRFLMILGALPALLTFLIRLFVPESERWVKEQGKGATSHWAARDLLGVIVGLLGAYLIVYLWIDEYGGVMVQGMAAAFCKAMGFDVDPSNPPSALIAWLRVLGTLLGLLIATLGYMFPVLRYLQRSGDTTTFTTGKTVRRMLLGACLGGIPLLGTWASMQWAPVWADKLIGSSNPNAKAWTQFWMALGAIISTLLAALLGGWFGRRRTYALLCASSLVTSLLFFWGNTSYGPFFLATCFLAGGCTASFYGWLPLYLPELFPTRVRATGQGFSFNFGRIIAVIGALQTANLIKTVFKGDYSMACSTMSMIYLVGMIIIWLAPETRGNPLPE